jgi:hypothetical protein
MAEKGARAEALLLMTLSMLISIFQTGNHIVTGFSSNQ